MREVRRGVDDDSRVTMADTDEDYFLKFFQRPRAADHNELVKMVRGGTLLDDPRLLISRSILGTTASPLGGDGTGVSSPFFRGTLRRTKGKFAISFEQGFVGGVEPRIGDRRISEVVRGRRPELTIEPAAFDEDGVSLIYVELELVRGAWTIEKAKVIASPKKRGDEQWMAHDLLGQVVLSSGGGSARYVRNTFLNHGHMAVQRQSNGIARNLFWALI